MSKLSTEVPIEVEEILIKLSVLGGIPPGTKYDISARRYVSASSYIISMYRTIKNAFYGKNETRDIVYDEFKKATRTAVEVAKKFPKWKDKIKKEVANLQSAVNNQMHVYSEDPDTRKKFELLKQIITEEAFEEAFGTYELDTNSKDVKEEEKPSEKPNEKGK